MLIGCCRCEGYNESGIPYSVNSSVVAPVEYSQVGNNCLTGNCIGSVAPRRYRVTFNYDASGAGPYPQFDCSSAYNGDFILHWQTPLYGDCYWQSTEKSIRARPTGGTGYTCFSPPDSSYARFTFGMKSSGLTGNSWCAASHRYFFTAIATFNTSGSTTSFQERTICYSSSLTNSNVFVYPVGANPINCLSAITLPIYSNAYDQSRWVQAVAPFSGVAPPAFVTLTPEP